MSDIDKTLYEGNKLNIKIEPVHYTVKNLNSCINPFFITSRIPLLRKTTLNKLKKDFSEFELLMGRSIVLIIYVFTTILYYLTFCIFGSLKEIPSKMMGNVKFSHFSNIYEKYKNVHHDIVFIFFGDNSQGDPIFGEKMLDFLKDNDCNHKGFVMIRDVKNKLENEEDNIVQLNNYNNMYIFKKDIDKCDMYCFVKEKTR